MSLLPEHSNDLQQYLRATKGTPYAPYNPPINSSYMRAIALLTVFPLLGALLPVAVDNELIDMAALGMLALCPLLGIPAVLMAVGSDKAHRRDENDERAKKAKLAGMLANVGMLVGVTVTTASICVAFYAFLQGSGHSSAPAETTTAAAPAEGEAAEGAAAGEAAAPAEGAKAEEPKAEDGKAGGK